MQNTESSLTIILPIHSLSAATSSTTIQPSYLLRAGQAASSVPDNSQSPGQTAIELAAQIRRNRSSYGLQLQNSPLQSALRNYFDVAGEPMGSNSQHMSRLSLAQLAQSNQAAANHLQHSTSLAEAGSAAIAELSIPLNVVPVPFVEDTSDATNSVLESIREHAAQAADHYAIELNTYQEADVAAAEIQTIETEPVLNNVINSTEQGNNRLRRADRFLYLQIAIQVAGGIVVAATWCQKVGLFSAFFKKLIESSPTPQNVISPVREAPSYIPRAPLNHAYVPQAPLPPTYVPHPVMISETVPSTLLPAWRHVAINVDPSSIAEDLVFFLS